jgi:hypothetical protein
MCCYLFVILVFASFAGLSVIRSANRDFLLCPFVQTSKTNRAYCCDNGAYYTESNQKISWSPDLPADCPKPENLDIMAKDAGGEGVIGSTLAILGLSAFVILVLVGILCSACYYYRNLRNRRDNQAQFIAALPPRTLSPPALYDLPTESTLDDSRIPISYFGKPSATSTQVIRRL